MAIDIVMQGPVLTGQAGAQVREMVHDIAARVTEAVTVDVHAYLPGVLKHPTGVFEGSLVGDMVGPSMGRVFSDLVYAPWLEGTSKRNQSTRFKGYHTFRLITAEFRAGRAAEVARPVVAEHVGRMS